MFQPTCSGLLRDGGARLRSDVKRDMNKSTPDFLRIVWPVLQEKCPELRGGRIQSVEGKDKELAADLDILAGIDAYQRWDRAMRGIACRVQWERNYRSFTVRTSRPHGTDTEYQKRLAVLKRRDEGFLYPYWTIQAYLAQPGGRLLSVALAKTAELYLWIEQYEKNVAPLPRRVAKNGGEGFLYVSWDHYRLSGNYLFEYPSPVLSQRIDALLEQMDVSSDDVSEETYQEYADTGMQQAEVILRERDIDALLEWAESKGKL